MTDDKKIEKLVEFEQVQSAHAAFQQQIAAREAADAFNEAVENIARLTPAERAKLRQKKAKKAKKLAFAAKKQEARKVEVRRVLKSFNPTLTRGQVRHMAEEYVAAQAEKPKG